MSTRLATLAVIIATSLLGFASVCRADTYPIGAKPIADIAFPDAWKVKTITRGLQGATKDDEVYLWAEIYQGDALDDFMAEHDAYYKKQGVDISSDDPKTENIKVNGVPVVLIRVAATWKGKPTVIDYAMFNPAVKTGRKLMVSYWASPEGDKMYEPDLNSILSSVKFRE